tara:strand:+ start:1845 stop:2054 length:210 start_codon:yes stop_codon:yes gene_type:complete
LESVFSICEALGIDDAIHWMNNVQPIVVDWWIAYFTVKAQRENEAYNGAKEDVHLSGEEASQKLKQMVQ